MEKQSLNKIGVFRKLTIVNIVLTLLAIFAIIGVIAFCYISHIDRSHTFTGKHAILCSIIIVLFCLLPLLIGITQSILAKKIGQTVGSLKSIAIIITLCALLSLSLLSSAISVLIIFDLDHNIPPPQMNDYDPMETTQALFACIPAVPQLGATIFNIIIIAKSKNRA